MPDARLLIPKGMKPADVRASRIDAPVRRLSGETMGTGWSLSFVAYEKLQSAAVVQALDETFELVIRQMSGWEPGSDLARFNAAEPGWREIPRDFAVVLRRALKIAELTGGAYDPALGHRVDALGFGPSTDVLLPRAGEGQQARVFNMHGPGGGPAPELADRSAPHPIPPASPPALAAPPPLGGGGPRAAWRDVKLDTENLRVFQPGGAALDLSSIAKGYAVDLCAERLRKLGVSSFLMEIGGEFVGQGVKPDAQPWWVQLELSDIAPAPGEPPQTDVALVNLAVATSGDFIRRHDDGASHLLDGRTGRSVTSELSGLAVLHASAMEADGWATALFALGLYDGLAMAEAQDLAAVFAVRAEDGARTHLSSRAVEMLG
jgi:thiamine biosynthesis lipoprotein